MGNVVGDKLLLELTIDKEKKTNVMGLFSDYNLSEDIFIREFNDKLIIKFIVKVKDLYLLRDTFGKEIVDRIFKEFEIEGVIIEKVYLKLNELGETPYVFNYKSENILESKWNLNY